MKRLVCAWAVLALAVASCGEKVEKEAEPAVSVPRVAPDSTLLRAYPLDSMDGVLTLSNAGMDGKNSSDGRGCLMITTDAPMTVRLFETGDIDIENARIIYRAKLRTRGVEGKVYLEMWCSFPGVGEAFSRALQSPLTGTMEWTSQETPFFLKAGENPDNIKLNVVIEGKGRVWVDDIRLEKGPLGGI